MLEYHHGIIDMLGVYSISHHTKFDIFRHWGNKWKNKEFYLKAQISILLIHFCILYILYDKRKDFFIDITQKNRRKIFQGSF